MGAINIEHLPQYKIEDYQRWEGDWELIRGIPYSMSPSENRLHQDVARNTLMMLMNALESSHCNCKLYYELDLILAPNTVVRPDLMIFCEKIEEDFPTSTPDLVVEIISKSSRQQDQVVKFDLYQEFGVEHYLIIDPDSKTILAYQLKTGQYMKRSLDDPINLKGCNLKLDLSKIFE